jgi:hypothetical protein
MRDLLRIIAALLAVFTITAAGCHSAPAVAMDHGAAGQHAVLASLVTVHDESLMAETPAGWETYRNDPAHPLRIIPDHGGTKFVERYHREHLRTSSGRPREHTFTRTKVIQRHGRRW